MDHFSIKDRIQNVEKEIFRSNACLAVNSKGRAKKETVDELRTDFQ